MFTMALNEPSFCYRLLTWRPIVYIVHIVGHLVHHKTTRRVKEMTVVVNDVIVIVHALPADSHGAKGLFNAKLAFLMRIQQH